MITAISLALAAFLVLFVVAIRWLARSGITRPVWRADLADALWGVPPEGR